MDQEGNVFKKNEKVLALNESKNKTYPNLLNKMNKGSSKTDTSLKQVTLSAYIRKLERGLKRWLSL